jgi:hypothetical protein
VARVFADPAYLTQVRHRLQHSQIPDDAFRLTREVLGGLARAVLTRSQAVRALAEALDPDTGSHSSLLAASRPKRRSMAEALQAEGLTWDTQAVDIATVEATAVNAASIAAELGLDAGAIGKRWTTMGDRRVRPSHQAASGQEQPLAHPFEVGGEALQYPGDPAGSPRQTARCRCSLVGVMPPFATCQGAIIVSAAKPVGDVCPPSPLPGKVGIGTRENVSNIPMDPKLVQSGRELAVEKFKVLPEPTDADRLAAKIRHDKSKRQGGDDRPGTPTRRRLKQGLLDQFGDGKTCPCLNCGMQLDFDTVTMDRLIPGHDNGRYVLPNLIPLDYNCNRIRNKSPFTELMEEWAL